MAILVPAVLGGLALTLMAVMSLLAARRHRREAARPATTTMAGRILVHDINDDRCVGCDACVAVCPTNVLDLVDNKSRVLNFGDCIQCEQCMWVCPTEALVMHIEGTEPPPLKVPEIDPHFQTAVPGQYLIGEVAGKPLVKNAANLGRMVIEHALRNGLSAGATQASPAAQSVDLAVDVVIVGSGPAGLSAALTCIHRGLSYVVLDKEQIIASTVARYPKGKLVMAEPYDVQNISLLPVFDSSKEQLVPIWQELVDLIGVQIRLGEAVEEIQRDPHGLFMVRTTVARYLGQRVVLATGTRGKPRTLGVPGENLRKVQSLLEDPDHHAGQHVLVVGGGDSALEAAIALADAGAQVTMSYRGRGFSRAAPKNRQTIDSYAAQRRLTVLFQSNVARFTDNEVTIALPDGETTIPNHAAFVLIGADPPIKWLEKMGVGFVERPHSYALGKTDQILAGFLGDAACECPETAAAAAALLRGEVVPTARKSSVMAIADKKGKKGWLKTATAIFTVQRDLDKPMPLSEFAQTIRKHSGRGRRDLLDPAERTRVLRMLRDVGGRMADEESQVVPIPDADSTTAYPAYMDQRAAAIGARPGGPPAGATLFQFGGPAPAIDPSRMRPEAAMAAGLQGPNYATLMNMQAPQMAGPPARGGGGATLLSGASALRQAAHGQGKGSAQVPEARTTIQTHVPAEVMAVLSGKDKQHERAQPAPAPQKRPVIAPHDAKTVVQVDVPPEVLAAIAKKRQEAQAKPPPDEGKTAIQLDVPPEVQRIIDENRRAAKAAKAPGASRQDPDKPRTFWRHVEVDEPTEYAPPPVNDVPRPRARRPSAPHKARPPVGTTTHAAGSVHLDTHAGQAHVSPPRAAAPSAAPPRPQAPPNAPAPQPGRPQAPPNAPAQARSTQGVPRAPAPAQARPQGIPGAPAQRRTPRPPPAGDVDFSNEATRNADPEEIRRMLEDGDPREPDAAGTMSNIDWDID